MKNLVLNVPTLAFIVGTRAALGVGIGLLVSEWLPVARRRKIGATLVAIGAATTVPAVISLRRSRRGSNRIGSTVRHDAQLVGATRFPRKGDDDQIE